MLSQDASGLDFAPFGGLSWAGGTLWYPFQVFFNSMQDLCAAMCQRKDFQGIDLPEKDFWATALHFAAGKRRQSPQITRKSHLNSLNPLNSDLK